MLLLHCKQNICKMKRLFIIILSVLLVGSFPLFAKGNDIVEDKTDENGVRVIETKMEALYVAKQALLENTISYFCLRAEVTPDTTNIYLIVMLNEGKFEGDKNRSIVMKDGHTLSMDKGRKLLLKYKNGIIELENSVQINAEDCVCVSIGKIFTGEFWVIKPQYILSQEAIQLLLTEDVKKMRIETNANFLDRNAFKFKKHFTNLYKALTERIATPSSIYDGF